MSVVIVGAGHAGVQVADSLRQGGYLKPITIVTEENDFPYQRPPLSKDFFDGNTQQQTALPLRNAAFFETNRIDLIQGQSATAIDRCHKRLQLDDGSLSYDHLVLATGSKNHLLTCPGSEAKGIKTLRTLSDAMSLQKDLLSANSVVIVGAGFIGLEFAAAASDRGVDVTVLSHGDRPLRRAVTPQIANWLTKWHQNRGVDFRFDETAVAFSVNDAGRVHICKTSGGDHIPTDLVLVGIGAYANDSLAEASGLETDNGVVVDENMQTSDPSIFAVGDCAKYPASWANELTRVESVQNAVDQAKHVAEVLINGPKAYGVVPWFWSIQGKNRLQIVGVSEVSDQVILTGDVERGKFSVLCFRNGVLVAVESINMPGEHIAARKLLNSDAPLLIDDVTGPDFSIKSFLKLSETSMAVH